MTACYCGSLWKTIPKEPLPPWSHGTSTWFIPWRCGASALHIKPKRSCSLSSFYEHPVVRFKGSHGEIFEGNLTASGNEISGTVRAGGRVLHRLLLKRQKAGVGPGAAG